MAECEYGAEEGAESAKDVSAAEVGWLQRIAEHAVPTFVVISGVSLPVAVDADAATNEDAAVGVAVDHVGAVVVNAVQ